MLASFFHPTARRCLIWTHWFVDTLAFQGLTLPAFVGGYFYKIFITSWLCNIFSVYSFQGQIYKLSSRLQTCKIIVNFMMLHIYEPLSPQNVVSLLCSEFCMTTARNSTRPFSVKASCLQDNFFVSFLSSCFFFFSLICFSHRCSCGCIIIPSTYNTDPRLPEAFWGIS